MRLAGCRSESTRRSARRQPRGSCQQSHLRWLWRHVVPDQQNPPPHRGHALCWPRFCSQPGFWVLIVIFETRHSLSLALGATSPKCPGLLQQQSTQACVRGDAFPSWGFRALLQGRRGPVASPFPY